MHNIIFQLCGHSQNKTYFKFFTDHLENFKIIKKFTVITWGIGLPSISALSLWSWQAASLVAESWALFPFVQPLEYWNVWATDPPIKHTTTHHIICYIIKNTDLNASDIEIINRIMALFLKIYKIHRTLCPCIYINIIRSLSIENIAKG